MRRLPSPGLLLLLLLCGCDTGGSAGGSATTSSPSATASPTTGATVAASATATAATAAPYAGQWRGSYQASQAKVFVPPGVEHPTQEKDDGSASTGKGTVVLTIDAEGQVTGKATGALGTQSIRGVMHDDMLRAGVAPLDPTSDDAMTGVLVGRADTKTIAAELRASNHDATLVRSSEVRLERR